MRGWPKGAPGYLLVALLPAIGCASVPHEVRAPAQGPASLGVVFTADGAGGFEVTPAAMRKAIADEGLPLGVETVEGAHRFCRFPLGQNRRRTARRGGGPLAPRMI